jgi:hypothetical protein
MDIDKFIVFFKAVGFPAAIAVWFLWKIQAFMEAQMVNSAATVELLRQLISIHK